MTTTIKSQFAPLITKLRKKAGYTQEEVAQKLKKAKSTIGSWEESRSEPDIETLNELLVLYGCPSLRDVLCGNVIVR